MLRVAAVSATIEFYLATPSASASSIETGRG
jgi:hypothetical protein